MLQSISTLSDCSLDANHESQSKCPLPGGGNYKSQFDVLTRSNQCNTTKTPAFLDKGPGQRGDMLFNHSSSASYWQKEVEPQWEKSLEWKTENAHRYQATCTYQGVMVCSMPLIVLY